MSPSLSVEQDRVSRTSAEWGTRAPEFEPNPYDVVIVTTTFYPRWRGGEKLSEYTDQRDLIDKVRGDLALTMIETAVRNGFRIVVVDGGQNALFRQALVDLEAQVVDELPGAGMSGSRRQGFREAALLPDVKAICWCEPEKVSMPASCIELAMRPVLTGEADVVVPSRYPLYPYASKSGFDAYPDYQVAFETEANRLFNSILDQAGLLPPGVFFDAWFGPRIIKNDTAIIELFLREYEYTSEKKTRLQALSPKLLSKMNPDLWANATFLSLINALHNGLRVKTVRVPYVHPAEQSETEKNSPLFLSKRRQQMVNILRACQELVRLLGRCEDAVESSISLASKKTL